MWTAATHELLRVTRERDRELGILAHELRQPLAAALAAERLLAASGGAPSTARAHSVLHRQLLHLAQLVDNLFDYSRLALGTANLASHAVDVRTAVSEAVEAAEPAARDRQQLVTVSAGDEPAIVLGDATRLRQAIGNLLQNAVRYTPPHGRIDVTVVVDADTVAVCVRDTGEGVPADRRDAIFEPFVRLSASGPGLGIGLTLVRRIAELHGGHVQVDSAEPETGSVFTFVLPRAAVR